MAIDIFADLDGEEEQVAPPLPRAREKKKTADIFQEEGVEDFSGVESSVTSTEGKAEEPGFLDTLGAGIDSFFATNRAGRDRSEQASALQDLHRADREVDGSLGEEVAATNFGMDSKFPMLMPSREDSERARESSVPRLQAAYDASAAQAKISASKSKALDTLLGEDSVVGTIARVSGGLASQAEYQLMPLAGGFVGSAAGPAGAVAGAAAGSLPMAEQARQGAYLDATEWGATREEAEDYAVIMAGLEFAPSVAGGAIGGAATRLGLNPLQLGKSAVKRALYNRIKGRGTRIAWATMAEAGDELVAGALQDVAQSTMHDNDFFTSLEAQAELGKQVHDNATNWKQNYLERGLGGGLGGAAIGGPAAVAGYEADMRTREADIANDIRASEAAGAERRAAPVLPSTEQTTAPAPEVVETAPVADVVVEDVVAETPAAADNTADDPDVRKSDIAKINYWKRDLELDDDIYQQHLMDLTGKSTAEELTPTERQTVISDLSGKPYEAPKKKQPKAAAPPVNPEVAPIQNELNEIEKLLKQESRTPIDRKKSSGHDRKVREIARSLARGNTQQDVDVANLIKQGKLQIVDNSTSVGFDTDNGAAASYNPDTGEMYIFTDNMQDDAPVRVETLAAAIHEASHAGQFNGNDARESILNFMMGEETMRKANAKVVQAAKRGNKIAQRAVMQAMDAGKASLISPGMNEAQIDTVFNSPEFDARVRNLEIIPYLGTEVTRARGKPLGTVGAAWTDVQSGLRSFARKTFGPNTEFDFNELMSATQRVAGDIVNTEIKGLRPKPNSKTEVLNMVGGPKATGFGTAKEREAVYNGFVDQKERFEFSDSESAVTKDMDTLDEYYAGTPVYLGELLGHQSLYEQYPEALTIAVQYNPALAEGSAFFDATHDLIEVGPQFNNDRRLRSVLLHEVQHWIQEKEGFINGFNDDNLVDPAIKASREEATSFINQVVGKLDLPAAIEQLPEDLRTQWENESMQSADPLIQAEVFLAGVYGNAHPNGHVRNRATRYSILNARRAEINDAYDEHMAAAWDAYITDYGETEARNTQRRSNITQADMDNSFDPNPEYDMQYANFNVPVERTQNSMKLLEQKNPTPKKSANKEDDFGVKKGSSFNEDSYRPEIVSWAKRIYGALQAPNGRPIWQNFTEWFGDSVMVNEDGTPRMLFHGTTAEVDYSGFMSDYDYEIGTHVGTEAQASDPRFVGSIYTESEYGRRGSHPQWGRNAPGPRVVPLYVNFKNPLEVKDNFGSGPRDVLVSILDSLGVNTSKMVDTWDKSLDPIMKVSEWMDSSPAYNRPSTTETAYREAWVRLRDALGEMGYDALVYTNVAEGFNFRTQEDKDKGKLVPSKSSEPYGISYYPYASDFPESSYVMLDPAQAKSINNSGDFDGRNKRLLNQRARRQTVYHGTPNTFTNKDKKNPLGKFDLSFMSSGEGQQAVGFGFYFSGSWEVSDGSYRKALAGTDSPMPSSIERLSRRLWANMDSRLGGVSAETYAKLPAYFQGKIDSLVKDNATLQETVHNSVARDEYVNLNLSRPYPSVGIDGDPRAYFEGKWFEVIQGTINRNLENINNYTDTLGFLAETDFDQFMDLYTKSWQSPPGTEGELYYVEIPEDENLALWDAPYGEQPENVRVILDTILASLAISDESDAGYLDNYDQSEIRKMRFRDIYYRLAEYESVHGTRNGEAALSAKLDGYGIPGHKFKPIHMQFGGKSKNPPYHNYVIYNPASVKIVGRDAREKGQTRQEMLDWAATIADRNMAKARAWESDARARLEGQQESDYGRILYMASRKGTSERKQKTVPVWLRSLFGSTGATNSTIREIQEHAVSSPSNTRMLAENYEGQYRAAVTKEATRLRITESELDKRITDAIDSISTKTSTYDSNLEAYKTAVAPFGEAGRVLVSMREMVDNISLEMLRDRALRARNGEAMSPAEKKQYKAIMANLGRYGHRQYAAHLRDAGFGEAVWDSYNKAKNKDKLTDADKSNALRVTKALRVLVDQIIIPEDGKLATASQDHIDRLYTTWVGRHNADALTYDEKRTELSAIRAVVNGDKEAMLRQAERTAEEILGLHGNDTGMIADYYRGGKVDLGILKKRQKLPPEIRELMGEIKDPAMRLLVTASKQAEFVARNQMLMELTRINDPYHVQPPGPSGRTQVKGMVELKGDTYGAMNGWWVSPELHNLVRDNIQMLATFEDAVAMAAARPAMITNKVVLWGLDKWSKLAANSKMLQIIGNPINFLFNLFGGPRMMLANGNINPKHLAKAFGTATQLIAYARNPSKAGENARRVTAAGVVDSAFIGEISSDQYRTLLRNVEKMVGTEPTAKEVRDFLRKSGMTIKESYAMMDVMFKIANFYQQADAVLPQFYKAEGIQKTAKELDREAADIVNRTNITYKRAATVVKAMERGGITQFGTYLYEVFRTEVQNLGQGIDELVRANNAKTPEGRRLMTIQATRRVGGQLLSWSLTAGASRLLAELTFGDDEEDKFLRYLLPDFARAKDFITVGKDKNGHNVMIEFSRLDPVGPATDIMRRMINLEVTPAALAEEVFGLYIAPRIAGRIISAVKQTLVEQKNVPAPLIETVWPGMYEHFLRAGANIGLEEDTTRAWTRLMEVGLPGGLNTLRESNPKIVNNDGTPNAIADLTRAMGVSYVVPEPTKQMSFASSAYDDTVQSERRKVAGLARSYSTPTDRDVMIKLTEARTEEFNAYKDAYNIYRGMKALGMSENEISSSLKDARASKELMRQLRSGEFKSQIVSRKSFNGHRDTAIRRATTEAEREEIRKKWDSAWEIVKGVASDD